jgi:hypothetical protein
MPRSNAKIAGTLANAWSAPSDLPVGSAGRPLFCVASTYTFHAPFFESELLPRFLGLKFDETEGVRPFVVEREQALATSRACVLVNADHLDPSQSTLRWDQFPVRVPGGGVQHSKVVMLMWENSARLIVSSANLTRQGYRRNREIAGVVDFYDHETSAPRKLIIDAIRFIQEVSAWVRASDAAVERFQQGIEGARGRLHDWRSIPADFRPREIPRVFFVGGLPRRNGGVARSPLDQLLDLWGSRRADEITVMTPFVGDLDGTVDPVVERLLRLPRTREATGYLVVPGQPSEKDTKRMVVGLPRRFLEAWASTWRTEPGTVPTYVVPLCRQGEKANRDLHAKGVLVAGDGFEMLLCGSSNFSPRGMGVGMANAEANLCYADDYNAKRNGLRLEDRLPVDWEQDLCETAIWPETAEPIDDEQPGTNQPIPEAFLWAVYNQRSAVLTIAMDTKVPPPAEWSMRWPGEGSEQTPPLLDHQRLPQPPPDGRVVLQLSASLRGANIAGLRITWRDEAGAMKSGLMPVHVESSEDLLPPEEFRSLTARGIVECLLSGREPAEWVAILESRQSDALAGSNSRELDSLRAVDTSSYMLYRTRRLGTALTAQGERLLRTVRTREAISYQLRQDPLGPRMLAEALIRESEAALLLNGNHGGDASVLLFSLAEISLMLAHVARRLTEARLRPLFWETVEEIDRMSDEWAKRAAPSSNLKRYLATVRKKCTDLLERPAEEDRNAS